MFTLLPSDEKKKLAKEYKQRLAVIFLVFLCFSIVVAGVLLLPSYLLSNVELKESNTRKDILASSKAFSEESDLRKTLQTASDEVDIAKIPEHFPSQIFLKIQSYQSAGIKLTAFSYAYDETGSNLTLSGVASDRQTLINFNNTLKNDPMFATADFPISSLSSSKDISFTMTIQGNF